MDDLNAASVQDVQDFFRTYYAPNNAVIALVGDLNTKETLAKMEKYFGNIPRQTSPKHVDLAEPEMHAERREKMDDKLARLTRLQVGYKVPAATSADSPAVSALASIFGGGESSRLYQTLVKEKEVCSGIGAGSGARMGPGLLQITCTVRPGKTPEQAEALIAEEIAKLQAAPVTDKELKRVRTNARRSAVAMRESALNRAITLADSASMYDDPNRINTNTDKLAAVTSADIQRVAKAYLRSDNRVVMTTFPEAAPAAPPAAAKPKAQ
jgi:predicted Zn-dependent peptidase